MNLLTIDTATEACSVALSVAGSVTHRFEVCPQQHSQKLLPMIDELLNATAVRLTELDALGFGQGPGSFTGVRIATSMLQGLALGTNLPCVGVSTMAAMAQQAIQQGAIGEVVVAIDARMGEVYFARYLSKNGLAVLQGDEQVLSPDQAAAQLPEGHFFRAGTGWQAYQKELPTHQSQDTQILYPDARFMLALVERELALGHGTDVEQIEPVYLRDKVTWKKLPGRE